MTRSMNTGDPQLMETSKLRTLGWDLHCKNSFCTLSTLCSSTLEAELPPPPPVLLATLEGIDPHTAATEGGKRKQQREEFSETQGSSVVLEEGVCSPSLLLPTQWMEIGCQEDPCKSLSGYSSAGLA